MGRAGLAGGSFAHASVGVTGRVVGRVVVVGEFSRGGEGGKVGGMKQQVRERLVGMLCEQGEDEPEGLPVDRPPFGRVGAKAPFGRVGVKMREWSVLMREQLAIVRAGAQDGDGWRVAGAAVELLAAVDDMFVMLSNEPHASREVRMMAKKTARLVNAALVRAEGMIDQDTQHSLDQIFKSFDPLSGQETVR